MEEIRKSIKSFNPDSVTGRILEVTNYPIPRKEKPQFLKLRRLRGIQLIVSQALESKNRHDSDRQVSN